MNNAALHTNPPPITVAPTATQFLLTVSPLSPDAARILISFRTSNLAQLVNYFEPGISGSPQERLSRGIQVVIPNRVQRDPYIRRQLWIRSAQRFQQADNERDRPIGVQLTEVRAIRGAIL